VTGVDLVPHDIHPRAAVDDAISRVTPDAITWRGAPADVVVAVGVEYVFGGLAATLAAVRDLLRPGGRAVVGASVWEREPTSRALDVLGLGPDDLPDIAAAVRAAQDAGFDVLDEHVRTVKDWNHYEWSWCGSLTEFALGAEGTAADRAAALEVAREHRAGWLEGYRRVLGFVTLVLTDRIAG
jgi:SAM-dependent methyltransferase